MITASEILAIMQETAGGSPKNAKVKFTFVEKDLSTFPIQPPPLGIEIRGEFRGITVKALLMVNPERSMSEDTRKFIVESQAKLSLGVIEIIESRYYKAQRNASINN